MCNRIILALILSLLSFIGSVRAQLPEPFALPSLDLRAGVFGRTAIATPDGGAIVAGDFRWIGGDNERLGLVKLQANGAVDPNWNVTAAGTVWRMVLLGDDLYLAGQFTSINSVPRKGLARVSLVTGALSSWDPNASSNSSYVFRSIVHNSGALYVSGTFTQLGAAARTNAAKLALDGALDASWNPTIVGGDANAMVSDGAAIYLAGAFTQVNGTARQRAAKLSLDTATVDPSWAPSFNSVVFDLAVDGGFLYGIGCFNQVNSVSRDFLARVSTAGVGTLDVTWNPAPNIGCTNGLTVNASHVYVGGSFTALGGSAAGGIGRVSKTGTGSLDATWQPQGDQQTYGALPLPDSSVLLWGEFVNIGGTYSAGLARVNNTGGQVGPAIYAEQRTLIKAMVGLPDNSILIGGGFTRSGTVLRRGLLKIAPSGLIDESFTTTVRGRVETLKRDSTHVYVGGTYSQIGGASISNLARMTDAGAVDAVWNPQVNGQVVAMAFDAASNIYIGGSFTQVLGSARNRLASLNRATLGLNPWNPNVASGFVLAIEPQGSDFYIGGGFTTIGGLARANLAKVSSAGITDTSFIADTNNFVRSLLAGPAGTLYVGGNFTSISGLGRPGFARLLTNSGAPDPAWSSFLGNGFVGALSNATNGIYVAGFYQSIGGVERINIARLSHSGAVAPLFAPTAVTNDAYSVIEQAGKVYVGGFSNYFAPTSTRQISLVAFPLDATPQSTTLTITQDEPENSQPFQTYKVDVSLSAGAISPANQSIIIEDDFGATCTVFTNGAGTGSCELASRIAGTRQLRARFTGTPLLLASSDTEPHTVNGTSGTPPVNTAFDLRSPASFVSAKLSDGSVILAGSFTRIGNTSRRGLAKLLPNGTLDPNFSADVIGSVSQVLVDANDSIYAIGFFGYIDGVLRRDIAKLDASGNVINSWTAAGRNGNGLRAAMDANGDLILQNSVFQISGTPNFYRTSLLKLSGVNGELVAGFAPEFTTANTSTFPQLKIFAQGNALLVIRGFDAVNGIARRNAVRLDSNGVVDATWNPSPNSSPEWLSDDGAGGIYLSGSFTEVAGQSSLNRFVRLNADGSLNAAFNAASNGTVTEMIHEGGALWATGFFTQIGGINQQGLIKLNATTGGADTGFTSEGGLSNFNKRSVVKIGNLLCGDVSSFDFNASDVRAMGRLCRNADSGARLATVLVSRQASVRALARQPDGATLIGGFFARIGSTQRNLVRVSATGGFDIGFNPLSNTQSVSALHVRGDGNIYVDSFPQLLKLNASGIIDPAFQANFNGSVVALLPSPDGLIAGGFFSQANGLARVGVAKVDFATGAVNPTWNPGLSSGQVRALASDSSGAVYLGGSFTSINGNPRNRLAKLGSAGALDLSWQADTNSSVLSLLADGSDLYAGGFFTTIGGQNRRGIAKVAQSNGAVQSWNPSNPSTFPTVYAIAKAQDGGILTGGFFNRMGGAYRSNAAKLDPVTGLADPTWNPSFDGGVFAILTGYGGTPTRIPLSAVEQNIAIGGDFEFAGSTEMPGFTAVSSVGVVPGEVFCSGFEDASSCRQLP